MILRFKNLLPIRFRSRTIKPKKIKILWKEWYIYKVVVRQEKKVLIANSKLQIELERIRVGHMDLVEVVKIFKNYEGRMITKYDFSYRQI